MVVAVAAAPNGECILQCLYAYQNDLTNFLRKISKDKLQKCFG